jgi:hypothetical protein
VRFQTLSSVGSSAIASASVRISTRSSTATQNLLCAYLAAAVFLGLAGNALFGAWWLDPIAALVIAGISLREGLETWRGEGCCAAPDLSPEADSSCTDPDCSCC